MSQCGESQLTPTGEESREAEAANPADDWETCAPEEILPLLSHELRTPLSVITGFQRLLLAEDADPLTPQQRGYLEKCVNACRRLDNLVSRLVEDVRKRHDPLDLTLGDADLAATVERVAGSVQPLLEERGQRIDVAVASDLGALRFDALRIEQVLNNLLANAIQHSPDGSALRVAVARTATGVEVSVCDEGPGIAAADRERIFGAYVRSRGAGEPDGQGLGLAICGRIVRAHGGAVGVAPRAPRGSRFWFSLPGEESDAGRTP